MLELRALAEELGDRFDLRAFHDELLGAGAIPLDALEVDDAGSTEKTSSGGALNQLRGEEDPSSDKQHCPANTTRLLLMFH